jgi:RNA polymerase sigma factor (sigma-70 family)
MRSEINGVTIPAPWLPSVTSIGYYTWHRRRPQVPPDFPSTRPSLVDGLRSGDPAGERAALERLAEAYWRPIYKYLRLRWRKPPDQAEDLTQSFFAAVLDREIWRSFDRERGRLQSFLRRCVDNHAAGTLRAERALKRGGELRFLELDTAAIEGELAAHPGPGDDPAELFHREWLREILAIALARLDDELTARGKTEHLEVFRALCTSASPPTHRELAAALGISAVDVNNRLAYAKRALRRVVVDVLRDQTASDEELAAELAALQIS